jgi:hypothetical protein
MPWKLSKYGSMIQGRIQVGTIREDSRQAIGYRPMTRESAEKTAVQTRIAMRLAATLAEGRVPLQAM